MSKDLGSTRRRKRAANSGRVEYNTPRKILDCVLAYAPIVCDPCWNARSKVKAPRRFTIKQDGKSRVWPKGLTFINPPYGAAELTEWSQLAIAQASLPGREIVMLVPASPEFAWFESLLNACDGAVAVRGRVAFDGCRSGAFFGSALFYFGKRPSDFIEAFSEIAYPLVNNEVPF